MYYNEKHAKVVEQRGDNYQYIGSYKKGDILYRTSSKKLFASLEDSIKPYIKKIPLKTSIEFKIDNAICIKTNYNGEEIIFKIENGESYVRIDEVAKF